jgi:mannose-6-phosphate isomerase class I
VKFVDAAEPLSFQVHPDDSHDALAKDECGKPESWLVLNAKPGAGIWIGFSRTMSNAEIATRIRDGLFNVSDLQFVPVQQGDWFNIAPGVPHAIGPGVLIAEPQRVLAGRKGVTWRIWDWNRTWNGAPRPLHIEQALSVINGSVQWGAAYAEAQRSRGHKTAMSQGIHRIDYSNPRWYACSHLVMEPGRTVRLEVRDAYAALVLTHGSCTLADVAFKIGEPGFIPATCGEFLIQSGDIGVELLLTTPASAHINWLD